MNLLKLSEQFDRDYFQNGVKKGISFYENFRWIPHVSFPVAMAIKKMFPDKRILDYGCAMGYVVYALRLLNVEAYGYDISDYAISEAKEEVKDYVFKKKENLPEVDVVVGKDVLEHIPYSLILAELKWVRSICKEACFVVPLGEDKKYRIPEYGLDKTHIIIENEEWWAQLFINGGFTIEEFYHHIPGIKDNWVSHHEFGNGVFLLRTTE